ncbi:SIR2 family protein [Falsihalocynthiibacter sp. S25ZX9]|uniref:P-loop NTPase n=1 Tax=Falsihalocynthiibacter sp. S25ZX9 TaxID=3240870 RepID=UPI00350EA0CF
MARKKVVSIPNGLVDAMREQRAILFLGSGASLGSSTSDGRKMPSAGQLSGAIADEFLSSKFKKMDLMRVAELALSQAGTSVFYQWLREFFEPFCPTEAHRKLGEFRWRAIVTTNYDLLVEDGYKGSLDRLQKLVTRVKDDEPIETMLSRHSHPLEFIKLHGCINHVHDKEIPLVLTPSSYNDHENNRQDLYARLESWGREYPIVFCGHSLDDLHIRRLVENPRSKSRPIFYLVSPDIEPEERQMWSDKRVETIKGTFSDFISGLETALPPLMRVPAQDESVKERPYRKHFKVLERESDETQYAFQNEVTFLHAGFQIDDVDPGRFYAGYDQRWGNIARDFDVQRRASFQLLEYIVSENDEVAQLGVIQGAAGYGKSIALMRAAWELAVSFNEFVIWMDDDSKLRSDVIRELFNLSGKRIYVFLDRAGLNSTKIEEILALSSAEQIPVTIMTAERKNEWSMYCQRLEKYRPEFFELKNLSEKEVVELLAKLKKHSCEGILQGEPDDKKREMIVERLDRQLLVALYEITRGKSFEEIVGDEYSGVSPESAQALYLDICTLHRFDVPVRAGVISRISGISFRDFETELFEPLQDLVFTKQNAITGDWEYRSRHPIVSEMVFNQICRSDADRRDQISRVIDGLDTSYRSDDIALSQLIRGRNLAETFEDVTLARQVYDIAVRRNPSRPYISQQRAIFEYTHTRGSLDEAEAAVAEALSLEPSNHSFRHTEAQILRRKALETSSEFARHSLRSQSRAALDKIPDQSNAYVLGSRARLRVDSAADALQKLRKNPSEVYEDELADAIDQAERALHRAFNMYPGDPDFLEAEARLKEILGDTAASTERLQRAWVKMPRGSGVAKRLAKRYIADNKNDLALKVLGEALERDPSERSVNLLIANIYFSTSKSLEDANANRFLAQSFVHGDREYYARFIASAVAFARHDFDGAYQLADEVNDRAPGDFYPQLGRAERWLEEFLMARKGSLKSSFGSYVFVSMRDCPRDIFGPASKSEDDQWDTLNVGADVVFDVEYTRKGPIAVKLRKDT